MKQSMFPAFLALLLLFAFPAFGAEVDLSGTWNYVTSKSWGPHNDDTSGICVIEQEGEICTFTFKTGCRCEPKPVCSLSGKAAGKTYTFSTKDQVDDEGGIVETKMNFTVTSASSASGTSLSKYVHPSGFTMKWGADIRLFR
jgi:hypothetical protein